MITKITNEVFSEALEQYKPLINKFATKFSRNYTQKEEVEAILMTELLIALQKHDANKSNMLTYLHNRFRWACLNQIINSDVINNKHEQSITSSNEGSAQPDTSSVDTEDMYDTLLKKLDPQSKEALIHIRSGKNFKETGELMNISQQRVQQLFTRICDKGHEITGKKR
jgi:RNA polymerase sigma factor (sigma-70 family)